MGVHADGSGVYWTESSPDADQPHGLAYREFQDLRVGVRKRLEKEHVCFSDSTVGGNHIPGKVQCLGFNDGTGADLTKNFSDGSWFGHCPVWDTSGGLWCITCDNSYAGAVTPKRITLDPGKVWENTINWPNKEQQFTGIASFKGAVDISDALSICAGTSSTKVLSTFGDVSIYAANVIFDVSLAAGTFKVAGDFSMKGEDAAGMGVKTFYIGDYGRFWFDGSSATWQGTADATAQITYNMHQLINSTYTLEVKGDISFNGAGKLTCTTVNYWCSSEVDCSVGVGKYIEFTHSMGTSNVSAQLQCCTDGAGGICSNSWMVPFPYPSTDTAIQIVDISTSHLKIVMGTGALFASVCSQTGAQTYWSTGWARVILTRLN
jgi:hypothetical protein